MQVGISEITNLFHVSVSDVYRAVKEGNLKQHRTPRGDYLFDIEQAASLFQKRDDYFSDKSKIAINNTIQTIYRHDARNMCQLADNSVHLAITSPPYLNAKKYSFTPDNLGNIDKLDEWLEETCKIWREVYRVLQPGRKFFLNVMNVPVKTKYGFKSLNLFGKTVDVCENIGFLFKREIVWHKTNSVRAHFGSYPYPGNILINYAHEFIIELEKPTLQKSGKYDHVPKQFKEASRLDKDFWQDIKASDVWQFKTAPMKGSRNHPSPFPLELPYRLIKAYSYLGETVLDPMVGSGTTLLAAAKLGRNGIGYELEPSLCKVAIASLKALK